VGYTSLDGSSHSPPFIVEKNTYTTVAHPFKIGITYLQFTLHIQLSSFVKKIHWTSKFLLTYSLRYIPFISKNVNILKKFTKKSIGLQSFYLPTVYVAYPTIAILGHFYLPTVYIGKNQTNLK
jgi:hypothetical protein